MKIRRAILMISGAVLAAILLSITFLAGYYSHTPARALEPTPGFALLSQVQGYLDQYYIREQPPSQQLQYGAIRGLLGTLNDKFTFFVEPPVAQSESNVLAGTYGGIGVQIQRDEAARFVLYPFRDGPAAKAGMHDGDILHTINGKIVPPSTQQDAVDQMMRGEVKAGNGITLSVLRPPSGEEVTFTIPFAVIDVPSVIWRALIEDPDYGYLQIQRFTNRTPDEVRQALTELQAKNVKALVVDMRNNPGGLLDESVTVAGLFLNGGTVFIEKQRDHEKIYTAPDGSAMTTLPMVVLVNNGTASAAELVAGALRDRGRAILIGQQTYGKGSVQLILQLSDGSSVHVTTAEWYPPSRTPLDGKGLTPTITMIPDPNGRDVELGEALRYLKTGKS